MRGAGLGVGGLMGPEWYFNAYEACEELYANWDSMSDAEKEQAVNDYVLDQADVLREIKNESDV